MARELYEDIIDLDLAYDKDLDHTLRSSSDMTLPDLEDGTEADIVKENVLALSAVYFAAMLEELKFFNVMDKVCEQIEMGVLRVSPARVPDALWGYIRDSNARITEHERRALYARSFGLAQASVEITPNREFNDLWIHFLSTVSACGREAKGSERRLAREAQVFESGRNLAINLSRHGNGLARFAAVELNRLIATTKSNLSAPDILAAFGVRDVWQLIERVSNVYLGGSADSVRQRTMAQSGAKIMQWIASHAPNLSSASHHVDVDQELIALVERWLAVMSTSDSSVEVF